MKVNLFQQVPYRFLPEGFEDQDISSVVSTPYAELVEPDRMFDSYRWFLLEGALVDGYRELGVDRLIVLPGLDVPTDRRYHAVPIDDIFRAIDQLAELVHE